MIKRRICVYCGSRMGAKPSYLEEAKTLGKLLADRQITLVYGGAHVGLMGAIADACLTAGGEVIGVIPNTLVKREVAHRQLTELHVVVDMHERKAKMAHLADAFIAMPGGLGTLEELFEMLTWAMLSIHQKPIALLNVENYWKPLLSLLDAMVSEGFVSDTDRQRLLVRAHASELLDAVLSQMLHEKTF